MSANNKILIPSEFVYLDIEPLINKYAGNVPRYTSYPTAVEFS